MVACLKTYLIKFLRAFRVRGYQSQVKLSDHMGGSRLACARYTQDPIIAIASNDVVAECAGVLSRGVGLRGFESHPPHQWDLDHVNQLDDMGGSSLGGHRFF